MTADLPTPGQVSAEDRERAETTTAANRVAPTPGSLRCPACHGPVLRFPSGLLRCVDEGNDVDAGAVYVLDEA